MKSADCRRRVSDSEKSAAGSHSMTVKIEPCINEEPEWVERGASEAAAEAGLYAHHKIKDELKFGPEMRQQQDIAISMRNDSSITEEAPCKLEAAGDTKATPDCGKNLRQHIKVTPQGDIETSEPCPTNSDCKLNHSNSGNQENSQVTPHYCHVCSQKFRYHSDLTAHVQMHTGQKPYLCNICDKQFTQQSILNRHIRIHTGEKPYNCDICDRHFTCQWDLTRHFRIHTGEKPHTCITCNRRFTDQSTLTRHVRIHTGEKPYSCSSCDKRFAQQSQLNRHLRIHHRLKTNK